MSKCRVNHGGFYLRIDGFDTRDKVANLRFSDVLIHRETLAGKLLSQIDSYIGFVVLNSDGKNLGTIIEIGGSQFQSYLRTSKTMIPNVPKFVTEVRKSSKTVMVNWSDEW